MKLPLVQLLGACLYLIILLPVATATAKKNDTNIRISVSLQVPTSAPVSSSSKKDEDDVRKMEKMAEQITLNVKTTRTLGVSPSTATLPRHAHGHRQQEFKIGDKIIADWSEDFGYDDPWIEGTVIAVHPVNDEKGTSHLYDVKYHDDDSTESNIHPAYLLPITATPQQMSQRLIDSKQWKVIPLDPQTFSSSVGIFDGSTWLIKFYHRGCQHCINFEETYYSVGRHYMYNQTDRAKNKIRIARVNCGEEKLLSSRFNIRSYPSFFLIKGWNVYQFEGIRSKENLIKFVDGDYKQKTPIPFYESPMGPTGQMKGMVAYSGISIANSYLWYQEKFGLSYVTTGILLFVGLFCFWFFGIIAFITISLLMSTSSDNEGNNKVNNNGS